MRTIDGSHGEGGGQILRTALTLSILAEEPVRIENIRANRSHPGLRPQHLTAVRAAAAVCNANLDGDELDSQTVTMVPGGRAQPGTYAFDVAQASVGGSAGSIGLIFQTVLLPLALVDGKSTLTLRGGTHVAWAPSVSYLEHVFLPTVSRMGIQAQIELERWGFYPAGGGEARVRIQGRERALEPIQITTRGDLERVWGIAAVTNLPSHIPQRMANRARNVLAEEGLKAQVEPRRLQGAGPGAGIFLFAEYDNAIAGFTAYGRKGLPANKVADNVCEDLLVFHRAQAPIDPHLADQLILPMAFASGSSQIVATEVTRHLLTNLWVVRQFLEREVWVDEDLDELGRVVMKEEGGGV